MADIPFTFMDYSFVSGDSYTTTTFNFTTSRPPSPSQPLGTFPGATSADGENWVDYLTVTYNASLFLSYNLAFGGATLDGGLVPTNPSTILSVKQQITGEFIPGYVSPRSAPSAPNWAGRNTLFLIFIGINDVGNTYTRGTSFTTSLNEQIFSEYAGLVTQLYSVGARNFVFLNVPTIDRSPGTVARGAAIAEMEKVDIVQWNQMLVKLADATKANHSDTNVWVFDNNALFTEVLNNKDTFPETAGLKNITDFCAAYENGTPTPDFFDTSCGVPVNEYFWLNSLHIRPPMHQVIAQVLSRELLAGPNIC
ncbi:hypothetical protein F5884DRAFT_891306 [Xylogone sp. PMI_703]|nr:hypothetical protein F5884DRAFT_891306 [Xylogone sp. PMI_703]